MWWRIPKHNLFVFKKSQIHQRFFINPLSPQEGHEKLRLAKQALLNNVKGFIPRQRLRLRLFLFGQARPLKIDDVMALFSWFVVGHYVFFIVGTTTFVSLLLGTLNVFSVQNYFKNILCDFMTMETGYLLTFENFVPRLRAGCIRFENVRILSNNETWTEISRKKAEKLKVPFDPGDVDINWTYWDCTVDSIDVTLSFWRWIDGKGMIKSAKFKGVRGFLNVNTGLCNRSHIVWDESIKPTRRIPQVFNF
jgi:distribution and morphology protein 31